MSERIASGGSWAPRKHGRLIVVVYRSPLRTSPEPISSRSSSRAGQAVFENRCSQRQLSSPPHPQATGPLTTSFLRSGAIYRCDLPRKPTGSNRAGKQPDCTRPIAAVGTSIRSPPLQTLYKGETSGVALHGALLCLPRLRSLRLPSNPNRLSIGTFYAR